MQCFSNLQDWIDKEAVIKFLFLLTEKGKHFFAKLLLHRLREVVKQTEQIFKTNQFTEIVTSHHYFYEQEL